jgi:hypothetical protein
VTHLDDYLAGEFSEFDRERKHIDKVIKRTISALETGFTPDNGWPYEISLAANSGASNAHSASTSTITMISAALAAAAGRGRSTILSSHLDWQPEDDRRLPGDDDKTLDVARRGLVLSLKEGEKAITEGKKWVFKSGTFGLDDIFTLCWLVDLYSSISEHKPFETVQTQLATILNKALDHRPEFSQKNSTSLFKGRDLFKIDREGVVEQLSSEHAFPLLRVLQLMTWAHSYAAALDPSIAQRLKAELQPWQEEFSRRIHEQLSFHAIPDSRFDPAELAFSLEGLAISRQNSIDRAIVIRAFEVLAQEQQRNPTLRPARPVKAEPSGSALFPVSVEIFNSLLRTGAIVAESVGPTEVKKFLVNLCQRYYRWVMPRLVHGNDGLPDIYGWHSEHINNPQLVHPWETSQILLFLLGYRTLVDQYLAAKAVQVAGLSVKRFEPVSSSAKIKEAWAKLASQRDPVKLRKSKLGLDLAVCEAIQREFVNDHAEGRPVRYSMILYGPPGTGKTNLAEELAKCMGYPLITVTVSDFLAEGGLQIEARAKAVFETLAAQKKAIIIFDEIDHLLLDRNSREYHDAESSIQLMVPGMLTKIKDLRSAERSIFIIATNYEERIDGAIKRPGRIDRKYAVLPPDWERRSKIVKDVLGIHSKKVRPIDDSLITKAAEDKTLLGNTARMSFPEISALLNDLLATHGEKDFVENISSFEFSPPVAELTSYLDRQDLSPLLKKEFDALRAIAKEAEEQSDLDLGLKELEAEETKRAGEKKKAKER